MVGEQKDIEVAASPRDERKDPSPSGPTRSSPGGRFSPESALHQQLLRARFQVDMGVGVSLCKTHTQQRGEPLLNPDNIFLC